MSVEKNLIHVSDATFNEEVINSKLPVVVDFWAPWCGPCQALGPIFVEVAKNYENKVLFAKLNVDDSTEIPSTYAVRGIPTVLLFKEGKVIATHVGMLTKSQLTNFVDNNI